MRHWLAYCNMCKSAANEMQPQRHIAVSQSFSTKIMTVQQVHSRKMVFCLLALICHALSGEQWPKNHETETCIAEYIMAHINQGISTLYIYFYTINSIRQYTSILHVYQHSTYTYIYIYIEIYIQYRVCFVMFKYTHT